MEEAATWVNCREDFVFDGALVDLLVPGTGQNDWELFWTALRAGPFPLQALRDGEPIPLPESAAWIFAEREEASVCVSIAAGTLAINCHFSYSGGDLELDVDPREVVTESAFESLLTFMRFLAEAVGLPVFATADGGSPPFAFLRVSPDGRATYLPVGSVRRP